MHDPNIDSYNNHRLARLQPALDTESIPEVSAQGTSVDIPGLVRKYSPLAIPLVILGAVGGLLVAAYLQPVYKARAVIEVQPLNSSVLKLQALEALTGDIDLQTEALILTSNATLRQVVERLQLEANRPAPVRPGFLSNIRRSLKMDTGRNVPVGIMKDGMEDERVPSSLAMALDTLVARPLERTHLIEISCDSTDPETASTFLNALADEYIQKSVQNRMQTVQQTTQWLSQQLEDSKNKMLEAEQRLQQFSGKSGNIFSGQERPERDESLADSELRGVQDRLSAAESELLLKQARYEMIKNTPSDALVDVLNDANLRNYQSQITNLRREEANLTTTLTPANPKVKRIESQIQELQGSLKAETEGVVKRITSEYETAKRDRDLLKQAYATQAGKLSAQGTKFAEYSALKRESESARQLYNTMLLQANQSNIVGSLPVNNIRLTEASVPPRRPYKPSPTKIIGGGAAVGFALCGLIGFVREALDKRLKSPHQARQLLNIPQLGVIPSVTDARGARRFLPGMSKNPAGDDGSVTTLMIGSSLDDNSTTSPKSLERPFLAESFRVTLASLMRESSVLHGPKTILVTSPAPGEGKTTIASNLGVALAETGRRVLVLDADFRRPRVHKVFGLTNVDGLGNLLNEERPISEYPKVVLGVRTGIPNLLVLPNGRRTENISMVLYSPRFKALLERLRTEFDTILIDAPPLLQVADARIISEMADAVVLVLRSGVTDKNSARDALDQLRADRSVILGTVLNDWKPTKAELKNSYYYNTD